MPRSVLSYVFALCLIIASTTHTFAFHFFGSNAPLGYVTSELAAPELQTTGATQSVAALYPAFAPRAVSAPEPAGCTDAASIKSLFSGEGIWIAGNIASAEDHQRCHAGISPALEHAGIPPAAEILGPPAGEPQSLLLNRYALGFKNWRFKPPLRPPQSA